MTIPFLIYSLLSLPLHFGLKKLVSSAFVSILVVISATILTFFIFYGSGNYLYDGHILSTILTIVVMIITIYEFISLERHVINLKMGLSDNTKNIPVETEYKFVLSSNFPEIIKGVLDSSNKILSTSSTIQKLCSL